MKGEVASLGVSPRKGGQGLRLEGELCGLVDYIVEFFSPRNGLWFTDAVALSLDYNEA